MSIAKKADPELWKKIKTKVTKSKKGGPAGKWSARKAQLAVKMYKDAGGKYIGNRKKNNSLTKWTNQNWRYNNSNRGRYLPDKVWKQLTPAQKAAENRRKSNKSRAEWGPAVKKIYRKNKF